MVVLVCSQMAATPARVNVQEPLLEPKGQQSPVAGASAEPAQHVERMRENTGSCAAGASPGIFDFSKAISFI